MTAPERTQTLEADRRRARWVGAALAALGAAAIAIVGGVIAGLAAWAFLFSSIVPGVLAVALIVYAVLTDAWGWTARALAQRLGQAERRRVLAYLEPRP